MPRKRRNYGLDSYGRQLRSKVRKTLNEARLLLDTARSELEYHTLVIRWMRTDPHFLYGEIVASAQSPYRPPPAPHRNGHLPIPTRSLSSNTRFVSQEVRLLIRDSLQSLAHWRMIEKVLENVVDVENSNIETYEDLDDCLVEAFFDVERILKSAASFLMESLKTIVRGHATFPSFATPTQSYLIDEEASFEQLLRAASTRPSDFPLFASLVNLFWSPGHSQILCDRLTDIFFQMRIVLDSQRVADNASGSRSAGHAHLMSHYISDLERASQVLNYTNIEQYIRSIDSLKDKRVLTRIWNELDMFSSGWYDGSLEVIILSGINEPPSTPVGSTYNDLDSTLDDDGDVDVQSVFVGGATIVDSRSVTIIDKNAERARNAERQRKMEAWQNMIHIVKWSVYQTFEKLFDTTKGKVEQDEFIKAMVSLNFGYLPSKRAGSRRKLMAPPNSGLIDFHLHESHGGSDRFLRPKTRADYANRLTANYNLTMRSFTVAK